MTKGLNRSILSLAVPSILANVTVPLVGLVDMAVAGHLDASGAMSSASFIAGVAVAFCGCFLLLPYITSAY